MNFNTDIWQMAFKNSLYALHLSAMDFSDEELAHLAKLCRIALTDEERARFRQNLSRILTYAAQLEQLDTSQIPPFHHVIENLNNLMREDVIGPTLAKELFLENAPAHIGGLIRIPPVIKQS